MYTLLFVLFYLAIEEEKKKHELVYSWQVWDGTKCAFPSWKTFVKEEDLEGDGNLIQQLKNLSVDVVVYDNHVQFAKSLKVNGKSWPFSLSAC